MSLIMTSTRFFNLPVVDDPFNSSHNRRPRMEPRESFTVLMRDGSLNHAFYYPNRDIISLDGYHGYRRLFVIKI